MSVAGNPIVCLAAQHINHIACGVLLPHAVDAAQQLLHKLGGIKADGRVLAVVAVAAGLAFFAKMAQQQHAAAFGGFADVKHGVELLQLNLLLLFADGAFLDALAQQH